MAEMKTIHTFESFNDPNNNPVVKIQISRYITKSDFFSMKPKAEKDLIKKLLNQEFNIEKFTKNDHGLYNCDRRSKHKRTNNSK
jgi:hypothetical protein